MKNKRFFSPYLIIGLSVTAIALTLIMAAMVGGRYILMPYLGSKAQAAVLPKVMALAEPKTRPSTADPDIVAAYEQTLIDVYQSSLPSVVNIRVAQKIAQQTNQFNFPFGLTPGPLPGHIPQTPEEFYRRGQGSGFVWDKEGHIVTNYHVVEDATDVEVVFADGTTVEAKVLGVDPDADLAVVKVDLPAGDLHPITPGDSDALQVGQTAIAIGNPFGQQFTMTSGIVSAVGRTIRSGNSPFSIPEVIQTDAPINPGNSGGPLLNRHGEVIGINTQIISQSGGSAGIGFAIPINIAKQVVPTLIKGEKFEYAWLGITGTTLTSEVSNFMNLPEDTKGALVIAVTQNSPADEAGLQGSDKTLKEAGVEYQLGGDVITAINNQPVTDMDDLITYLIEETHPGDEVTLNILHANGKQETVSVTLTARPEVENVHLENK